MASPLSESKLGYGPLLVASGALLWATDIFFRVHLVAKYQPLFLVLINHWICLLCLLPWCWRSYKHLRTFGRFDWLALSIVGIGSSCVGMLFFTMAFTATTDYAVPALVQKAQPLFAISVAYLALAERPPKYFWLWVVIAMLGVYLLSFGNRWVLPGLEQAKTEAIIFALLAAMIWGVGTVASRSLSVRYPFMAVTFLRYVVGTIALTAATLFDGSWQQLSVITPRDLGWFALMSLLPGLLALILYYRGMQSTSASTASLCELVFPLSTAMISALFLGAPLSTAQLLGAALLTSAVIASSRFHAKLPPSIAKA